MLLLLRIVNDPILIYFLLCKHIISSVELIHGEGYFKKKKFEFISNH